MLPTFDNFLKINVLKMSKSYYKKVKTFTKSVPNLGSNFIRAFKLILCLCYDTTREWCRYLVFLRIAKSIFSQIVSPEVDFKLSVNAGIQ